jgi:monovalent cation/proton antiporter MnhG/PhaG subunit
VNAVVGGVLTTAGVLLVLITAVGLLRFPDVFSRMHAASKTTSLGLGFTFAGVAVLHGTAATSVKLALAVVFMLLTQPIAVHLLGRAAHIGGVPTWEGTRWDELSDHRSPSREGPRRPQ